MYMRDNYCMLRCCTIIHIPLWLWLFFQFDVCLRSCNSTHFHFTHFIPFRSLRSTLLSVFASLRSPLAPFIPPWCWCIILHPLGGPISALFAFDRSPTRVLSPFLCVSREFFLLAELFSRSLSLSVSLSLRWPDVTSVCLLFFAAVRVCVVSLGIKYSDAIISSLCQCVLARYSVCLAFSFNLFRFFVCVLVFSLLCASAV